MDKKEILEKIKAEGINTASMYRSASVDIMRTDANSEPTISFVATTEKPARVWDWDRWEVVDEVLIMDGMTIRGDKEKVPLVDSHNRNTVKNILGSAINFQNMEVQGYKGKKADLIFSEDVDAQRAKTKILEGHIDAVSIGYSPIASTWVEKGKKYEINGVTYEGPLKITEKWELGELSLVVIGADEFAQKIRSLLGVKIMNEPKSKESQVVVEPTEPQVRDKPKEPQVNLDEIRVQAEQEMREKLLMCQKAGIDEGELGKFTDMTIAECRKSVLEKLLAQRAKPKMPSVDPDIQLGKDGQEKFREAALDALCVRGGLKVEKPALGYDEFIGRSLTDMAVECLRQAGHSINGSRKNLVGRALTTSDLPYLLSSVANKSLMEGWDEADSRWREWAATGSVPDFKDNTLVRLGAFGPLEEVPEGGEIKFKYISEAKETFALKTYAAREPISRNAIINDDLGGLTDRYRAHGEAAAALVASAPYGVLTANAAMGDGITLFHASHSNLGTAGAIGSTTTAEAVKLMKKQKDESNARYLYIRPTFYIAPVAVEGSSEIFFNSELLDISSGSDQRNPYFGEYLTRIYDPLLDDNSETAYYFLGPKGKTVKVFFLDGIQRPTLESEQGWSTLGIEYRVYIDCVAVAMDWRGMVKNAGA